MKEKGYTFEGIAWGVGDSELAIRKLWDTTSGYVPEIEQVIFNPPRTIVNWSDGTKTIVKCMEGDEFDEHVGFQAAVTRKVFGGHSQYKRLIETAQRICPRGEYVLRDNEVMKKGDILNWAYTKSTPRFTIEGGVGMLVSDVKKKWSFVTRVSREI